MTGFREGLDDLLFKYGYYLNEDDTSYYHAPDDDCSERPLKLIQAVDDALEFYEYGRD